MKEGDRHKAARTKPRVQEVLARVEVMVTIVVVMVLT